MKNVKTSKLCRSQVHVKVHFLSYLLFERERTQPFLGDAHVYTNHVDALQEQIKREPRTFPTIKIKRQVNNIEDFQFEDFEVTDYNPHPKISMEMAV